MSTRFFELLNCARTYVRMYVCRNEGQQAGKRPVHSIFSIKGSSFSFFSWNVDTISLATKNFNRMEGKFFPLRGKILTDFERRKWQRFYFTHKVAGIIRPHDGLYFPLNFPEQYWRRSSVEERGDEKNVTTTTSHGESWFHPLDFTELQPPSLQDFTTPWARYPNLVWRGRDSSEGTRDFGYRPTFDRFAAWTLATREMARGMGVQRQNLEGGNY